MSRHGERRHGISLYGHYTVYYMVAYYGLVLSHTFNVAHNAVVHYDAYGGDVGNNNYPIN